MANESKSRRVIGLVGLGAVVIAGVYVVGNRLMGTESSVEAPIPAAPPPIATPAPFVSSPLPTPSTETSAATASASSPATALTSPSTTTVSPPTPVASATTSSVAREVTLVPPDFLTDEERMDIRLNRLRDQISLLEAEARVKELSTPPPPPPLPPLPRLVGYYLTPVGWRVVMSLDETPASYVVGERIGEWRIVKIDPDQGAVQLQHEDHTEVVRFSIAGDTQPTMFTAQPVPTGGVL
ncbi:MAG: hypothetical protein KatS3mg082_1466 [Nitrospiraceae bacterium]|nr:MAG: hypothetical protein KatS3mg082_1466 [Nitrospiraceae bacterium]